MELRIMRVDEIALQDGHVNENSNLAHNVISIGPLRSLY